MFCDAPTRRPLASARLTEGWLSGKPRQVHRSAPLSPYLLFWTPRAPTQPPYLPHSAPESPNSAPLAPDLATQIANSASLTPTLATQIANSTYPTPKPGHPDLRLSALTFASGSPEPELTTLTCPSRAQSPTAKQAYLRLSGTGRPDQARLPPQPTHKKTLRTHRRVFSFTPAYGFSPPITHRQAPPPAPGRPKARRSPPHHPPRARWGRRVPGRPRYENRTWW